MWQPGETMDFRASRPRAGDPPACRGKLLDYAVVNIRPIIRRAEEALCADRRPCRWKKTIDALDRNGRRSGGRQPVAAESDKVRHDPDAIAAVAVQLAQEGAPAQRSQPIRGEDVAMETLVTVVILAAGLGTRMKSRKAKVLHRAGGKRLSSTWSIPRSS